MDCKLEDDTYTQTSVRDQERPISYITTQEDLSQENSTTNVSTLIIQQNQAIEFFMKYNIIAHSEFQYTKRFP